MEDSIVAKDVMEVEVRRRTALALSKAASIESTRVEREKARLGLDESLFKHQVCNFVGSAQALEHLSL